MNSYMLYPDSGPSGAHWGIRGANTPGTEGYGGPQE